MRKRQGHKRKAIKRVKNREGFRARNADEPKERRKFRLHCTCERQVMDGA